MGQRILVFESDAQFARELQANFRRLGADVEVVDDGNVGLERATANRPDLILLSIELPRMNGFLVCKKIKKSAELKDIPLVILSSEATEEIFEQHKKLRTRAEEYIHKPVSFAELLERIKEFVPIGTNGGAGVDANAVDDIGEDEVLDIDDMSEIGEEGVGDEAHADAGGKGGSVDDEIDAFAESAFGALVMNEDAGGGAPASAATLDASRKPARRGRSVPPEPMRPDALRPEPVRVPSPVRTEPREEPASRQEPTARHSSAPPPRPASEPAPRPEPGSGAFRLNAELNELREQLGLAQRRAADADRFEKELSDLKARAAKGGPISSREFLELREGLNRKDKEILDLREQLSRRDRQLIETNESSLTLERRQQDHLDRILEIERELADARDEIDLLVSARDDANKRAEEIKARSDKDVADVRREKAQAIEGFEAKHAEESARTSASHAMELERLRNEQETATATATEAHERAISEARTEHEATVARNAEAAATDKQSALDGLRGELTSEMERRLNDAEEKRKGDLAQAANEREEALTALRNELEQRHAAQSQSASEKHSNELAILGRKLSETETALAQTEERAESIERAKEELDKELSGKIADLERQLTTRTEERDTLQAQLAAANANIDELESTKRQQSGRIDSLEERRRSLEGQVDRARNKVQTDDQVLDRTRKALAVALGLLEEQKRNTLE